MPHSKTMKDQAIKHTVGDGTWATSASLLERIKRQVHELLWRTTAHGDVLLSLVWGIGV